MRRLAPPGRERPGPERPGREGPGREGRGCEEGSVALLTLATGIAACVLGLAVVGTTTAVGVAAARARTAADAAALAAMAASPLVGGSGVPEREAAAVAAANDARLVAADLGGWPFSVAVEVVTGVPSLPARAGLSASLRVRAAARIEPGQAAPDVDDPSDGGRRRVPTEH